MLNSWLLLCRDNCNSWLLFNGGWTCSHFWLRRQPNDPSDCWFRRRLVNLKNLNFANIHVDTLSWSFLLRLLQYLFRICFALYQWTIVFYLAFSHSSLYRTIILNDVVLIVWAGLRVNSSWIVLDVGILVAICRGIRYWWLSRPVLMPKLQINWMSDWWNVLWTSWVDRCSILNRWLAIDQFWRNLVWNFIIYDWLVSLFLVL